MDTSSSIVNNKDKDIICAFVIPVIKDLLSDFIDPSIISEIEEVPNLGAIKVNEMFIYLNICDKEHNLDIQFNKLKPNLSPDQWNKVLGIISMIIFMARTSYKNICEKHNIESILLVDNNNTTLYTNNSKKRIGIFVNKNPPGINQESAEDNLSEKAESSLTESTEDNLSEKAQSAEDNIESEDNIDLLKDTLLEDSFDSEKLKN